jgi:hypothetical protein
MNAAFFHLSTIMLFGRNPRPPGPLVWRRLSTLLFDQGVGNHFEVVGNGNEVIQAKACVDLDSGDRIDHDKHRVGDAIEDGLPDLNASVWPKFDDCHGESPDEMREPKP